MFGLFRNRARENATKCIRIMVHFRQVQKGITIEALDQLASEHGIIVARTDDPNSESQIPAFPSLLVSVSTEHPTNEVESLQFVGVGPMRGLHFIMYAHTESVHITANVSSKYTALAYKTARILRKVAAKVQPALVEGGFSGEYGLNELAADSKQPI